MKELANLDRPVQKRIVQSLQTRVAGRDPRQMGKALTGEKVGLWRYRVGDYRLVCKIDDAAKAVLILRVAQRREVYR